MKNLEKQLEILERENYKKEQAENRIKQIRKKISEQKRKAETKRKIEKGGVFESFERGITGLQETTTKDDVYQFLVVVFSDDIFRDMLKEISNKKVKTDTGSDINSNNENVDTEKYLDEK